MLRPLKERKQDYIDKILSNHPVYTRESVVAQRAAKSMMRLPEQTLFYIYHYGVKR